MSNLTREQAEQFMASLWPCGHMSHLDNPTRTFLGALVGQVPQGLAYSSDDPQIEKLKAIAAILRAVADHIEAPGENSDLK